MTIPEEEKSWLTSISEHLSALNYSFTSSGTQTLELPFGGEKASLRLIIVADLGSNKNQGWMVTTAWLSIYIPEERRQQALELLNKRSLAEAIGSFELRGGKDVPASVMFKIGMILVPGMLSADLIEYIMGTAITAARGIEDEALLLIK